MAVPTTDVVDIQPDEVSYSAPASSPHLPTGVTAATAPQLSKGTPETLRPHPAYDPLIQRIAVQQGVDPRLVKAVVQVESGYQPRARSSRGAVGLMQVLPATGRQYGRANLYDPASNLQVGTRHLRSLLDRFPVDLALAAYNAGEATVDRFGGIPPFQETTAYVARVLGLLNP